LTQCQTDTDCSSEEVCAEHLLTAEDGRESLDGSYCAAASDCFTEVQDLGKSLYVSCPATSSLVVCTDEQPCAGEGEVCSPHSFADESGEWNYAPDYYCTSSCFTEFEDLGVEYYASCPLVYDLVQCLSGGDCDADSEQCAPFTAEGDDGKTRVDGFYCANVAEQCYQSVTDHGVELYAACSGTASPPQGAAACTGECSAGEVCSYYIS